MILKTLSKIKNFLLGSNVDRVDNFLLGKDIDKFIKGIKNNILATFTLSVTLFLAAAITGTFQGVSFEPLNPPIREAAKILLGLPLYLEVALRAVESERPWLHKIVNRNRGLFGLLILPFIAYIGSLYPISIANLPTLTGFFLVSYVVTIFVYGTFLFWVEILNDVAGKKPDFLDRLLFAALPAALSTTLILGMVSFAIRIGIKSGLI